MRPTTMILGSDNRKKWSPVDVMIMQAYQIMEDERCPQHGGPRWLCDHADQSLRLRIEEDYCVVKDEVDAKEKSRGDKDQPGVMLRPVFYSVDGRDLSTYRASYREQQAREAAEDAESEGQD